MREICIILTSSLDKHVCHASWGSNVPAQLDSNRAPPPVKLPSHHEIKHAKNIQSGLYFRFHVTDHVCFHWDRAEKMNKEHEVMLGNASSGIQTQIPAVKPLLTSGFSKLRHTGQLLPEVHFLLARSKFKKYNGIWPAHETCTCWNS